VERTFWDDVVELSKGKDTRFIWPLQGEVLSGFGWREHPVLRTWHHHDGIDIDVPEGTIVHAASSGEVYFTGEQEGYGTTVIIEHPGGFYTIYGHLSASGAVRRGRAGDRRIREHRDLLRTPPPLRGPKRRVPR